MSATEPTDWDSWIDHAWAERQRVEQTVLDMPPRAAESESHQQRAKIASPDPKAHVAVGKQGKFAGVVASAKNDLAALAEQDAAMASKRNLFVAGGQSVFVTAGVSPTLNEDKPVADGLAKDLKTPIQNTTTVTAAVATANAAFNVSRAIFNTQAQQNRARKYQIKNLGVTLLKTFAFFKSGVETIMSARGAPEPGLIKMYGQEGIFASTPKSTVQTSGMTHAIYATGFADVMAGFAAGIRGIVFATLEAAVFAEVRGGYEASMLSGFASVVSSRRGKVKIEAREVFVGSTTPESPQRPTRRIDLKAESVEAKGTDAIHLRVGASSLRLDERILLTSKDRMLVNGLDGVCVAADGHAIFVDEEGVELSLKGPPPEMLDDAIAEAERARDEAIEEATDNLNRTVGNEDLTAAVAEGTVAMEEYEAAVTIASSIYDDACSEAVKAYEAAIDKARNEKAPKIAITIDGVRSSFNESRVDVKTREVEIASDDETSIVLKNGQITLKAGQKTWTLTDMGFRNEEFEVL